MAAFQCLSCKNFLAPVEDYIRNPVDLCSEKNGVHFLEKSINVDITACPSYRKHWFKRYSYKDCVHLITLHGDECCHDASACFLKPENRYSCSKFRVKSRK